jgi:hypothetical protein
MKPQKILFMVSVMFLLFSSAAVKEFHALKRGSDLYDDNDRGKGKYKAKHKGRY